MYEICWKAVAGEVTNSSDIYSVSKIERCIEWSCTGLWFRGGELTVVGVENSKARRIFYRNTFRMNMMNGTQQCCVLGKRCKYIPGCVFMKLAYEPYAVNVLYAACSA